MTETPTELRPCARGCTYPNHDEIGSTGEPSPDPRPATHGVLCSRCYFQITAALEVIPDLILNMRSQITKTGAAQYGDKITGSKSEGSPAPIQLDPLDGSDRLYAKLVSWSEVFAAEFKIPQPRVAVWINFREYALGFRPISPEDAAAITRGLTQWYLDIAERIAASEHAVDFHDGLCYGWEDKTRGVYALLGRYGVEPKPPRPPRPIVCEVCGKGEVFVKWPDKFNPDLEVHCTRCRNIIEPDVVNRHAKRIDGILPPNETWLDDLDPIDRRCTGSVDCSAARAGGRHEHGCYADTDGSACDHPELEHYAMTDEQRRLLADKITAGSSRPTERITR